MRKRTMLVLGVLWSLAFGLTPVFAAPVPDTGVTQCYDDAGNVITPCPSEGQRFYGQDANYSINPPSYTKLDSRGNALPVSATSWDMVRDNVTGLIWEVKRNRDGVKHYDDPRDADNTYTWYDPNPATNGGNAGTPGEGTDTKDFIDALNNARFGDYSDWRLPTVKELAYLVDFSIVPAPGVTTINNTYFPYTEPYNPYYWSSTTDAESDYTTHQAWLVLFNNGGATINDKSYMWHTRAVRGGQSPNAFVDNFDGTVSDTSTGLMWQQDTARDETGNYASMTWEEALAYCEGQTLGGHTDWRLPTINELRSLVDYSQYGPAIDRSFFPNTVSTDYCSSTTNATSTKAVWEILFTNGTTGNWDKSYRTYVRAVRGGQPGSSGYFVDVLGACGNRKPCYIKIQDALEAAGDGAVIKVKQGQYPENPVWSKTGTVTITGGWNTDFSGQDGTTSMYAPRVTGGGGVKVLPSVKIIPKP